MKRSTGNILAGVVVVAVFILLVTQAVFLMQKRNADAHVRQTAKGKIMKVLELAQKKMEIVMLNNPTMYTRALEGQEIAGFHGDKEFDDIAGGRYKVWLSADEVLGRIVLRLAARESVVGEIRGLRIVYDRNTVRYPLDVPTANDGISVHWGSMIQYQTYNAAPMPPPEPWASTHFPRLLTDVGITGLDTAMEEPNTDDMTYWTYYAWNNLEDKPEYYVDREYYMAKAKASSIPTETSHGRMLSHSGGYSPSVPDDALHLAVASPAGSGFFRVTDNAEGNPEPHGMNFRFVPIIPGDTEAYTFRSSTSVFYFSEEWPERGGWVDVIISTYSFIECELLTHDYLAQMVVMVWGPGTGVVQAVIPRDADKEYQHPAAQAVWTAGSPSMRDVWSRPDRCCYTLNNVSFSGHLDGEICLSAYTPFVMHGALSADCSFSGSAGGTSAIYYDERVKNHQLSGVLAPVQVSWEEEAIPW